MGQVIFTCDQVIFPSPNVLELYLMTEHNQHSVLVPQRPGTANSCSSFLPYFLISSHLYSMINIERGQGRRPKKSEEMVSPPFTPTQSLREQNSELLKGTTELGKGDRNNFDSWRKCKGFRISKVEMSWAVCGVQAWRKPDVFDSTIFLPILRDA